jgi:hypothetical protein
MMKAGVFPHRDEPAALCSRYSAIENASLEQTKRWPTVAQAQWLAARFGVAVSDLWPFLTIGPCSCDDPNCDEPTFNGRRAYGCQNRTPEGRARASGQGARFNGNLRPKEKTGLTFPCLHCGTPVYREPSRQRRHDAVFCTHADYAEWLRQGPARELDGQELWTEKEVAAFFGVTKSVVCRYAGEQRLPVAATVKHGPKKLRLYSPDAITHWVRTWLWSDDNRARLWLDPDHVVKVYKQQGWLAKLMEKKELSERDAEAVVRANVNERRAQLLPHKSGPPPAPRERWLAIADEVVDGQPWISLAQLRVEIWRRDQVRDPAYWIGVHRETAVDRLRKQLDPELRKLLQNDRKVHPA